MVAPMVEERHPGFIVPTGAGGFLLFDFDLFVLTAIFELVSSTRWFRIAVCHLWEMANANARLMVSVFGYRRSEVRSSVIYIFQISASGTGPTKYFLSRPSARKVNRNYHNRTTPPPPPPP
jgi:hypothetical protein